VNQLLFKTGLRGAGTVSKVRGGTIVRHKAREKFFNVPSLLVCDPLPGGHRWLRSLLAYCINGQSLFTFYGQLLELLLCNCVICHIS